MGNYDEDNDGTALSSGDAERLLRRVHTALRESETQRRDNRELLAYVHRMRIWIIVAVSVSVVTDVVTMAVRLLLIPR